MGVSGPPASILALFAAAMVLGSTAVVHAAPRRVAIVNGANDDNAGVAGAAEIRRVLTRIGELTPIPDGNLARALEGPLPLRTRERRVIDQAVGELDRAQALYEAFSLDEALAALLRAEAELAMIPPSDDARLRLAEVEVRKGLIYMLKPDRAAATEAFRLARTLDPARASLDQSVFDPEVVKTYASANAPRPADATIEVAASYDGATLWIDGVRATGSTLRVARGLHVVVATFPEHRSTGAVVSIDGGQTRSIKLELWPQSSDERAQRVRMALRSTSADYRSAAQAVATLTGVDAVVVVRGSEPADLQVAVFDQRNGGITEFAPLRAADPRKLFASILPRVRITVVPDPEFPPPPPPPDPWYKQPRWQLAIGGGTVATVIGIVALSIAASGGQDMVPVDGGGVTFGPR